MARIRKWKEKLLVVCVTILLSTTRGWSLWRGTTGSTGSPLLRTAAGAKQKIAFGLELAARAPYVRLVRASLVPVPMPLTVGAYVGNASSADAAPEMLTTGCASTCNTATAFCCSTTVDTCCNPYCTTGGGGGGGGGGTCWITWTTWGSACTTCGDLYCLELEAE